MGEHKTGKVDELLSLDEIEYFKAYTSSLSTTPFSFVTVIAPRFPIQIRRRRARPPALSPSFEVLDTIELYQALFLLEKSWISSSIT